jgi:hypothetical protein
VSRLPDQGARVVTPATASLAVTLFIPVVCAVRGICTMR